MKQLIIAIILSNVAFASQAETTVEIPYTKKSIDDCKVMETTVRENDEVNWHQKFKSLPEGIAVRYKNQYVVIKCPYNWSRDGRYTELVAGKVITYSIEEATALEAELNRKHKSAADAERKRSANLLNTYGVGN